MRASLEPSGVVEVSSVDADAPASPTVRIVGRVGVEFVEVGPKGLVRAAIDLRLTTRPSDAPGAIEEELSAAGEQPYDAGPTVRRPRLAQQLVERTTADLLAGYVERARLKTATPAEIHAAIGGDARGLREEAIRVAGERGLKAEASTLLPLLEDPEESTRDAALGALIALHERRAVTELARSRSLRDRREMRKVLEAIATLGGDEARDYLSFVAASHDDEEIRQLAQDGLDRLQRDGAAAGARD